MKLTDLPAEYQAQIQALLDVVAAECAHRSWDEIEPVLASYWHDTYPADTASWNDVRPYVRAACNPDSPRDDA